MDYESLIQQFFESLGYHVEKIPEGDDKSPDFLIEDGVSFYLLELKTKFPSEEQVEQRRKALDAGEAHLVIEPISRLNTLSGVIKKAKEQSGDSLTQSQLKKK